MSHPTRHTPHRDHPLAQLARERVLVLDGAMGTEIQTLGLSDEAFRGERFCDHGCDLGGNNELLTLTQPDAMRDIHLRYLLAGADIVETNTFSANRVSQSDYDTVDVEPPSADDGLTVTVWLGRDTRPYAPSPIARSVESAA